MRGGSIPLLAWGTLLGVLGAVNWIWTDDPIQVGMFGFAVLVVIGSATALALTSRRASLRRGPPGVQREPQAIPSASLGAVLVALAVASIVYGFAFGHFLIYFGAGLLIVSAAVVTRERLAARRTCREWLERSPP